MPEDRAALIKHYQDSRAALLTAIDGLGDQLLTEPTLDGWSVKDHLAHLAFWDDIRADEVIRISAGHTSAWAMTGELDEALNAMAFEIRSALPLDQVRWELTTSRQRLLDTITAATERAMDASLYGAAGLRSRHEPEHLEWIKRWRAEKGI